ncbi:MAG: ComEC family competence protein, partial [bacterium]|nr:ComEC family competence protein [bacterium]
MSSSKIFLYCCLAFVLGIFLNSFIDIPGQFLPGILILGTFLILVSVFGRYKKITIIGFCLLFLALGAWRQQLAENRVSEFQSLVQNKGKSVNLVGIVAEEPDMRERSQKLTVKNNEYGKILLTVKRYPAYQYGDKLEITGSLKAPSEDINGFNYKDYLKKDGIYSVMGFPKVRLMGPGFGNPVMAVLLSFKNKFQERAEGLIPSPQIGFLEALVFGEEGEISQDWKEKLNLTGTRHIAAVSGMNITIISALLLNFLLFLGLWRSQAFYLSVVLIFLYILMIGAPPSAVRAGVMAGLFLTAQHLGRLSAAPRAVVCASALMLGLNPLLLKLDVGFQLSFLATMG